MAHVTLRALRTLLEGADGKDAVAVLAMRPQDVYDAMIYENLMPLYFPRSPGEEHDAARLLPLHHEKIGAAAPPPPPAATATGGAALGAYGPTRRSRRWRSRARRRPRRERRRRLDPG